MLTQVWLLGPEVEILVYTFQLDHSLRDSNLAYLICDLITAAAWQNC